MTLIYASRRPEDAAFLDELQEMAQQNKNFHLVATMSEVNQSGRHWDGDVGLIDQDLIRRIVGDAVAPIYYVAGPPGMVTAMRQTLNHKGVNNDDIRSEEFYGY